MINSIEISNFQSHKHSILNFHPNVNVIVGLSDSGKSAIIRALRWLIWNRPIGDSFRSKWGDKTEVILTLQNHIITRHKDKENIYKLDKRKLETPNKGVPDDVINALNMSDVNIQYQLDRHFLLNDSPGEVAQHFNKVARLDKIDQAQNNIDSWIRQLTITIGHDATKDKPATGLIRDIKENKEKLAKFDHLEKFESEVEVLEGLEKQESAQIEKVSKLSSLLNQLEQIDISIQDEQEYLNAEAPVNAVLDLIDQRDEIIQNKRKMVVLLDSLTEIEEDIELAEEIIPAGQLIDELLDLYVQYKETLSSITKMDKLYSNLDLTDIHLKDSIKEYEQLHKEFEDNFPEECPLCGKPK